MSIKSFFTIVLKIIGIFFLKDIALFFVQMVSISQLTTGVSGADVFKIIFVSVVVILAYGLILYYLLFKTESLISLLKLDAGFDEERIEINIHRSTVLSVVIMLTALLMLTGEIPNFGRTIYTYSQQSWSGNSTYSYIIISGLKIIIALLLLGFQRPIVNAIELKRKRNAAQ